jgi:cysteinyl-tRNA synthetase
LTAGFDGVYLDIIDAYEYFGPDGESGLERESAAADMVDFIVAIAEHARATDEDFLIFPQNGSGIAFDADMEDEYFAAIDGIGVEDTFYFGDEENDNELDEQTDVTENLEEFVARGKTVLAVDYLTDSDKIDDFYERAAGQGYIPYCSIRELDVLTLNSGHEPD